MGGRSVKLIPLSATLAFASLPFLLWPSIGSGEERVVLDRPDPEGVPTLVSTGIVLTNIHEINAEKQSYLANVFVKLRWKDPRLAERSGATRRRALESIWHPNVYPAKSESTIEKLSKTVTVEPDGTVTYLQIYQGRFTVPLYLSDFPFDQHELQFRIASINYSPDEIKFIRDEVEGLSGFGRDLTVPDWKIGDWHVEAEGYQPILGDLTLASYVFRFDAYRRIGYFVVQIFIPLTLIIFMSWIVFWIDPTHVGPQLGIATTSMLTLIAYRFAIGNLLPAISYLTRMDYFMLSSTGLVFLALVEVGYTSRLVGRQKETLARRINMLSRILFPLAFVAIIFWSFVF